MQLNPCPFCGGVATLRQRRIQPVTCYRYWVECRECAASSAKVRSRSEAISKWNVRVVDPNSEPLHA